MNATRRTLGPRVYQLATAVTLVLGLMVGKMPAQTNDGPKILFLHLQLKDGSVSLIKASVRPGQLKPRPEQNIPDGLHFELTDGDGRPLWQGVIADPRSRLVEYQIPEGSGKLKRKKVAIKDPEFTLRVPALTEARRIEFYFQEPSNAENREQRKSLGQLRLP